MYGGVVGVCSAHGDMLAYVGAGRVDVLSEHVGVTFRVEYRLDCKQQKLAIDDSCAQIFGNRDAVWRRLESKLPVQRTDWHSVTRSIEVPVHDQAGLVIWNVAREREAKHMPAKLLLLAWKAQGELKRIQLAPPGVPSMELRAVMAEHECGCVLLQQQ